jgi:hypothetical protein
MRGTARLLVGLPSVLALASTAAGEDRAWWLVLDEPELVALAPEAGESYRLIRIAPGSADVVRISDRGGHYVLIVKRSTGVKPIGGYAYEEMHPPLTEAEWREAVGAIAATRFWNLPPHGKTLAADVTEYLLEGCRRRECRRVMRNALETEDIREALVFLMRLAGSVKH